MVISRNQPKLLLNLTNIRFYWSIYRLLEGQSFDLLNPTTLESPAASKEDLICESSMEMVIPETDAITTNSINKLKIYAKKESQETESSATKLTDEHDDFLGHSGDSQERGDDQIPLSVQLDKGPDQPLDKVHIKEEEQKDEPDSDATSTNSDEFADVIEAHSASNPIDDLEMIIKLSTTADNTETEIDQNSIKFKEDLSQLEKEEEEEEKDASITESSDSLSTSFEESSDLKEVAQPAETVHKSKYFIDDDEEDQFDIDDDYLRAEAERLERQAQETTTSCVAEAQVEHLFFIHYLLNAE